jgi:hypothetical protein
MTSFRVTFDEVAKLLYFKDTAEVGETEVIVKFPDGITVPYGRTLTTANNWLKSVLSRQDLFGNLMQGEYTFTVKKYNVGGTVLNSEETESFTLSYVSVAPEVTETVNPFAPIINLADTTPYADLGLEWEISTLLRIWRANNGFTKSWTSLQESFNLTSGGTWTGNYTYTFEYNAGYDHENGWVILKNKSNTSGSFVVNTPKMLPEISALLQCLYGKITLCCDNAQKQEMLDDYVLATSIMHNFVLAGQSSTVGDNVLDSATVTEMLTGTDCKPGILSILKKWGCADDGTIAETLLSAYDWCLCDTGGGGGEPSTAVRGAYNAGNGAYIVSDAIDDDQQWTFAVASGVGTFTQNLAGSIIFGGTIRGDASTASHTSNGATNSFKLVLPIPGSGVNAGYASALLATVQVWSAPDADPTALAPWVLDEGSVQKRITDISSQTVSFVFTGIGATYPDGWAVTFELA